MYDARNVKTGKRTSGNLNWLMIEEGVVLGLFGVGCGGDGVEL